MPGELRPTALRCRSIRRWFDFPQPCMALVAHLLTPAPALTTCLPSPGSPSHCPPSLSSPPHPVPILIPASLISARTCPGHGTTRLTTASETSGTMLHWIRQPLPRQTGLSQTPRDSTPPVSAKPAAPSGPPRLRGDPAVTAPVSRPPRSHRPRFYGADSGLQHCRAGPGLSPAASHVHRSQVGLARATLVSWGPGQCVCFLPSPPQEGGCLWVCVWLPQGLSLGLVASLVLACPDPPHKWRAE